MTAHRDRLEQFQTDQHAEQQRTVELARLAQTASERLPSMSLEQQREVLRLLQVRVTLLDPSASLWGCGSRGLSRAVM